MYLVVPQGEEPVVLAEKNHNLCVRAISGLHIEGR
jgi:hypothetical protein